MPKGRQPNPIKLQGLLGPGTQHIHRDHFLGLIHTLETLKVGIDTCVGTPTKKSALSADSKRVRSETLIAALKERCTAIHLNLPEGWAAGAARVAESLLSSLHDGQVYSDHFRFAKEGDFCVRCTDKPEHEFPALNSRRGIELGHTFYLGDKYSLPVSFFLVL